MDEIIMLWVAGFLGGACRCIGGALKSEDAFDLGYFISTVILPALAGGFAGMATGDINAAFAAGAIAAEAQSVAKSVAKNKLFG